MNHKDMMNTHTEKSKFLIIFFTALAVILLDQITKLIVLAKISLYDSIPIILNFFHLTYVQNTGAGFGTFQNGTSMLIWFSIIVIGLFVYFYDQIPKKKSVETAVALIVGGAIGNLIDRIRLGFVVDFLDFKFWPSFNIADSAISIGVIWLIIYIIKKEYFTK